MKRLIAAAVLAAGLTAAGVAQAATVLITGSNKGIGLEFAKQYAEKGWTVVATARKPDDAKELKGLAAKHKNLTVEKLDVTDQAQIAALSAKYKDKPIDVLINNAAVLGNPKEEVIGNFKQETFRQIMDVNAYGTLAVTEALLGSVKASAQKKVVVITSQAGSISQSRYIGGIVFYRMSKAAANMAMQTLAADTKGQGVTFASIAPGLVDTDMEKELQGALPIQMPKAIPARESVAGMMKVIEGLDDKNSAKVFNYTGENIPF